MDDKQHLKIRIESGKLAHVPHDQNNPSNLVLRQPFIEVYTTTPIVLFNTYVTYLQRTLLLR